MPVYLDCQVCGKEFAVPPCRAKKAKACSHECAKQVRGASRTASSNVTRECEHCGTTFKVPKSHKDRRRFCSRECMHASPHFAWEKGAKRKGALNPRWRGGRSKHSDGYAYLLVGVEHPFSNNWGYMLEHRAVMEQWLRDHDPDSGFLIRLGEKLYLSPEYHVHHKDENRLNNRISNLQCMTPGEHTAHHCAARRSLT